MQPPAILSIEKGECIYKCMQSDWHVDSDGPVQFRFISKRRTDGDIELVFFTQRQDNRKYVLGSSIFPDKDFLGVVQALRESIWKFFPAARMEIRDFADLPSSSYTAAPTTPIGLGRIRLRWHLGGLWNRLRYFFTGRPPRD